MKSYVLLLFLALCAGCADMPPPAAVATAPKQESTPRKFDFTPKPASEPAPSHAAPVEFPRFTDVAADQGIQFVFDNGASPKALMLESTGGGCGWIDYDRDGRIDLFLSQGGIPDAPPNAPRPPDVFYRQLDDGRFIDVAMLAGVGDPGFGHGVAVGDVDNDGFDDLFIGNAGRCSLYLNQGDGSFTSAFDWLEGKRDVWTSTVAWGDVDKDGDLDLYVCNYAMYDAYHPIECRDKQGVPSICHPRNVEPEPDEFFVNTGDGRLVESSQRLGLFGPGNKALGVVIADFTGDDWPDIFVANDTTANFLFVNHHGERFEESALVLGGAFSATGATQANMGIAFGDYDENGFPDVCITHFTGEGATLYQNLGPQGLQDVSALTGLREPTLPKLGFGTVMDDFNSDGHADLFITNGHIDPKFEENEGYEMVPQLFSFDGQKWQDGGAVAGDFFQRPSVGRGVATADYDDDGDLDFVVVHHNSPAALLRNDSESKHGLRIELIGVTSNRNAIGARMTVQFGERRMTRELAGGTSYLASHQRRTYFGLGDWNGPCHVEVRWPSGAVDSVNVTHPDQLLVIQEGHGRVQ